VSGIRIEKMGTAAVLRLDKARGNAIDEPLVKDLLEATRALAADPDVRGVLLASAHPKIFSPGLDLVTLVEYDRPAMERFMLLFAEMVWALYGLPKPMVAAVNGAAVAGGCILALTADLRILCQGAQIGLNEVKVGVPLPWTVTLLLQASVPPAAIAPVALLGRNFSAEAALHAGLAHETAPAEGFEETCLARLTEFIDKDAAALAVTKAFLRGEVLTAMRQHEAPRLGEWLDGWFSPTTQARIRTIVAGLTKRSTVDS
jgi:enoyl-CoA hydratase/carnithine racemase